MKYFLLYSLILIYCGESFGKDRDIPLEVLSANNCNLSYEAAAAFIANNKGFFKKSDTYVQSVLNSNDGWRNICYLELDEFKHVTLKHLDMFPNELIEQLSLLGKIMSIPVYLEWITPKYVRGFFYLSAQQFYVRRYVPSLSKKQIQSITLEKIPDLNLKALEALSFEQFEFFTFDQIKAMTDKQLTQVVKNRIYTLRGKMYTLILMGERDGADKSSIDNLINRASKLLEEEERYMTENLSKK